MCSSDLERRYAEPGPVRWELFRPPEGETAVLRTAEGRELARFEFSTQARQVPPAAARQAPALARQAEAPVIPRPDPAPRPAPEPPLPRTQAEARLQNPPAVPLAQRKSFALPAPLPAPAPPALASQHPPFLQPEPAPKTRSEARLQNPPVVPLPQRKSFALPALLPTPLPPAVAPQHPLFLLPEPAPKTRSEARLRNLPMEPIPNRKIFALPSASFAPADGARRAGTIAPFLLEPEPPRPVKPVPPPTATVAPIGPFTGAAPAWPGMGEALNLTRGPGGQKRILLSFDGGSSAEVATEVLDLLKARGVHTTLFLTGAFIQRFPALVKRMAAEGHELGNHTMNHPHFAPGMKRDPKWTRERIQRELLDADAALVRLLGRPMDPFWRAPYGEHTAEIRRWAEELGYRHVGWSEGADTLDWAGPKDRRLYRSGEAIVARLEKRLGRDGDGLIVLMHLGSARELGDRPTEGLGAFMDRARKEGWTFVSAGTILHDLGKPTWNSQQRLALLNGPAPQSR